MEKIYKTYKLKNLSVSRLDDELMIIINKKDRIELKRIKLGRFRSRLKLRHFGYMFTAAVMITLSVLFFSSDIKIFGDSSEKADVLKDAEVALLSSEDIVEDKDEKLKNELLASEQTDYSEEDRDEPLQIRIYKVQSGDTLSEIAKKFGVSMDTICGSSGLRSYSLIRVGQVLRIPNRDGILYTVKKNQKLIDIANKYKISIDKIIAQNNLVNPDYISVGDDVFIPDAKPQNIMPGFLWPVATRRVTSAFGWRRHPIYRSKRFHKGIDIGARYQWCRSTRYGKVTYAGWLGGYGKVVIISHPGGWKSVYAHLSRIIVRKGQYVRQGQTVAKTGNTGVSTGPHLHFEIIKNGRHVNPRKYAR